MFIIKARIIKEAKYMLAQNATLRMAAIEFNLSKSTIHKDMKERLKKIDNDLYEQIKELMQDHIKIRHIKGGEKTKIKYQALRL